MSGSLEEYGESFQEWSGKYDFYPCMYWNLVTFFCVKPFVYIKQRKHRPAVLMSAVCQKNRMSCCLLLRRYSFTHPVPSLKLLFAVLLKLYFFTTLINFPARTAAGVAVDPRGAEAAAENSRCALQLQRGGWKVRPLGHKNQQNFLYLLRHHCVAVSILHL